MRIYGSGSGGASLVQKGKATDGAPISGGTGEFVPNQS